MSDTDRLSEIVKMLYWLAEDNGLLPSTCLNPDEFDECENRDCHDCGWYEVPLRDELLRMGFDL